MKRSVLFAVLLGLGPACSGRPAATMDSHRVIDGSSGLEARPGSELSRDAPGTGACGLAEVGHVLLEQSENMKISPRLAWDGQRFGVVWHSQLAIISSLMGELRFTRVDASAKAESSQGIVLGADDGSLEPALLARAGEYTVLHRTGVPGSPLVPHLRRFGPSGQTIASQPIPAPIIQLAAMAYHPNGYALFFASPATGLMLVGPDGAVLGPATMLPTAQVMASLWLAPRPSGFAGAVYTTNSNATLHLLDSSLKEVGHESVGQGQLVKSPSFVVVPAAGHVGYAALYATSPNVLTVDFFDLAGRPISHGPIDVGVTGSATVAKTGDLAALWGWGRLLVVHPGPVTGQYQIEMFDTSGASSGKAVPLPGCLATSSSINAVWAGDRLVVAAVAQASGLPQSGICVSVMSCR